MAVCNFAEDGAPYVRRGRAGKLRAVSFRCPSAAREAARAFSMLMLVMGTAPILAPLEADL
jgi:hypothetical protein